MAEITYTLFICDLCGNKQNKPLSLFTLQSYGSSERAHYWEKHICHNCESDILKAIEWSKRIP